MLGGRRAPERDFPRCGRGVGQGCGVGFACGVSVCLFGSFCSFGSSMGCEVPALFSVAVVTQGLHRPPPSWAWTACLRTSRGKSLPPWDVDSPRGSLERRKLLVPLPCGYWCFLGTLSYVFRASFLPSIASVTLEVHRSLVSLKTRANHLDKFSVDCPMF